MIGPTVAAVLVAAGEEGPDELRRRAGEILSRREFVPPGETLVERVLGWIGEHLLQFFVNLAGGGGTATALVLWALLGGLVTLVVLLAGRSVGRFTLLPRPQRRGEEKVSGTTEPTAEEWLERARRAETEGDWEAATRAYYRSMIAELARREVVDMAPGSTPGQWMVQTRERGPTVVPPVEEATDIFETVWYGSRTADPDTARTVAGDARRVGEQARVRVRR
ncbi:MAG TPA: DUF4129 domain-containing protein [Acidimicrobiales bacterium]|nr:DUF4129 domain-containing protein [Acidimicrobiales bacterium]